MEQHEIKVLGVGINAPLRWKWHISESIAKGRRMGNMIRWLRRRGRGMRVESMRTMYLVTGRTAMKYAVGAWGGAEGESKGFRQGL